MVDRGRAALLLVLGAVAVAAAVAAAVGAAAPAEAQAEAPRAIRSAGPLEAIFTSTTLACQVDLAGVDAFQFFPPAQELGDCGTFALVDGRVYEPVFSRATSVRTDGGPFSAVRQSPVRGAGTEADPYRLETVVRAGPLVIRQTDTYVVGADAVTTTLNLTAPDRPAAGRLYRAGDCYLQDSDFGYGFLDGAGGLPRVGCSQQAGGGGLRMAWVARSPGAQAFESCFRADEPQACGDPPPADGVWARIAAGQPFPDSCRCDQRWDNGAGLAFPFDLRPGQGVEFAHDLVFTVPPKAPATASFTFDASRAACDDSGVRFDATASRPVQSWHWDFGDGATSTEPDPVHTFPKPRQYTVRLTVVDEAGATAVALDVPAPGDPDCCPVLHPLPPFLVREGGTLRFTARASDHERSPLRFSLGGGSAATMAVDGTFAWTPRAGQAGVHTFTVEVTDGQCTDTGDLVAEVLAAGGAGDLDLDLVPDGLDNCPGAVNLDQRDLDGDGIGDLCDPDRDGDGVPEAPAGPEPRDNCPTVPNPDQADRDGNGAGDACQGGGRPDGQPVSVLRARASLVGSLSPVLAGLLGLLLVAGHRRRGRRGPPDAGEP